MEEVVGCHGCHCGFEYLELLCNNTIFSHNKHMCCTHTQELIIVHTMLLLLLVLQYIGYGGGKIVSLRVLAEPVRYDVSYLGLDNHFSEIENLL